MKKLLFCALLAVAAVVALSPLLANAAISGQTSAQVETFAATCVMEIALPGDLVDGGVQYDVSGYLKGLTFDAAAVPFDGKSINFSGKESQVLAQRFTGKATIPAQSGGVKVEISASGSSVDLAGAFTAHEVSLGEKFGADYLDVASTTHSANGKLTRWSQSLSSDLNGKAVTYAGTYNLVSLDAASGLAEGSGSGSVTATKTVQQAPAPNAAAGLGLILAGGGGLSLLRRRPARSHD